MEKELCVLCGEPLENGCSHTFKKMCVNCSFCKREIVKHDNAEKTYQYFCTNENNKIAAEQKMIEAAKAAVSSYEIEDYQFRLKVLPLKKPTAKCQNWNLSEEVINMLKNNFV